MKWIERMLKNKKSKSVKEESKLRRMKKRGRMKMLKIYIITCII